MASVNAKIKTIDYNNIQTKIARVLGTGDTNYGYGQVVQSTQVTTSNKVTVEQYAALRYDIINAYYHLNGANPSNVDAKTSGDTIRYSASDEPVVYWETVTDGITTTRLGAPANPRTVNHGTTTETWPGTYGASWSDTLFAQVDVTFTTAAKARHFFNSGSTIEFTSSRTGGSTTAQNTSWTSLLSTAGTRIFGGNQPGTGLNPNDGTNYFRCSNVAQNWSVVTASSPYALNSWRISVRTPGVADNSAGTASTLTFRVEWIDDHFALGGAPAIGPTGSGTFGPDEVDGQIALTVVTKEATGTLVPVSAGTFDIETPTITVTAITPA